MYKKEHLKRKEFKLSLGEIIDEGAKTEGAHLNR